MSTTSFAEHQARVSQESSDLYLGYVCLFTVHDNRDANGGLAVSHQQVLDGLAAAGLTDTPPEYPKSYNLFRRVSTEAQRRKQPTNSVGVFRNYNLIEFPGQEGEIVRRIVMETIDSAGKRLDYKQLADVIFNKSTKAISQVFGPDHDDPTTAEVIIREIRDKFRTQDGMLTAYSVREFIRGMVNATGATSIRSGGGVYFVTQSKGERIHRIESFVATLPSNFAEFHTLPLIDDEKQRGMVKQAFESETTGAVEELIFKIKELRKAGKPIRQVTFDNLAVQYGELVAKAEEYGEMLEEKLNGTHSRLDLLKAGITRLGGNVGGDE